METKKKKAKGGQNFVSKSVTMYGKTYKLDSLPGTMQTNCGVYGLALKLNRSIAGMNADTHTDEERGRQIDATYDHLKRDQWNVTGEGKATLKKKLDEAKVKATPTELVVLKKLGLA
jgi:hypothetical protein